MTDYKRTHDSICSLGNALDRLEEILAHQPTEKHDFLIDGTIQRFEFCIELFWKVLQKILKEELIIAKSPRQVMQEAYILGLIKDETLWLDMTNTRNQTSHTYEENLALEVYEKIRSYYPHLKATYNSLKEYVMQAEGKL